ncbi:Alcohol oxidase [Paramyrothecium foliicola]|nr:Alcohol oxidase [Paramyrothecium foliicola]
MGLYTELPSSVNEVDVIIAGGGTAGCIIAARLSDADPNLSILIVEGGTNNRDNPIVVHPALFLANLTPAGKTAIFYQGKKSASTANRDLIVPSGGVLGGGSSINLMTYSRAQRSDFDSWNTEGWSAEDMLPYLVKLERYHGPGSKAVHGYDGPIQVSHGGFSLAKTEDDFIQAAKRIGWSEAEDVQGLEAEFGVQRNMRYVSPEGRRQDTAHAYLHPRLEDGQHPNLHVLVESQVDSVIFEGKRAAGVRFRRNPLFKADTDSSDNPIQEIRARRLVIVSSGGLGSPALLERSGIGAPEILSRAGVSLVADVSGVGRNYGDHPGMVYAYKSALSPADTLDGLMRSLSSPAEVIQKQEAVLGWTAMDITSKIRPSDAEVAALGPEFQQYWDSNYKAIKDKHMSIFTLVNGFPGDPSEVPVGQYLAISTFSAYPASRGYSHITGPGIDDALDFETGLIADPQQMDLKKSRWEYKMQREVMRRMATYRGEWAPWHPPFPAGSAAECISTEGPLPGDVQNIEYTAADDAVIDQWIRERISTFWHSQGTCKMAPQAEHGVVDKNLNVYGTERLKVADMSIVPQAVGANTGNTAMAIGEKAAAIFIAELGLK